MSQEISVIDNIIAQVLLHPGSTVNEVARYTGYSADTVFSVFEDIYSCPWDGIQISFDNYRDDGESLTSINRDILYNLLRWHISIFYSKSIKLPTGILDETEQLLLEFIQNKFSQLAESKKDKPNMMEGVRILGRKSIPMINENIDKISTCIYQSEWMRVTYKGPKKTLQYELLPIKIQFHMETGQWYLLGQDEDENTLLLRMDRIEKIQQTNEKKKAQQKIRPFIKEYKNPSDVIINVFPHGNVQEIFNATFDGNKTKRPDGSEQYTIRIGDVNGFLRWLRGFGSSVEVVYPEKLRRRMIDSARRIIKNYEKLELEKNSL